MTDVQFSWILILVAFAAANLPWLTERRFFLLPAGETTKPAWFCLLEWLLLYFVAGGIALGLEQKSMGGIHTQDWEFYVVTLCLFMVFALPGFIYRYDLKGHLEKARRRRR